MNTTTHGATAGTTHYRLDGNVAVIELDNGPLNVVSRALVASFHESITRATDDVNVRAVILTSRGDRAFCAGSDIGEFDDYTEPGSVVELKLRFQNGVFDDLEQLPKPTIAALDGLAFGGGLEIAMCCDIIVAHRDVQVALPEMRLGVFPSSGGPIRLARRVGPERAKYMMFTADPIDAPTAQSYGLFSEVVSDGTALGRAMTLAREFANRPLGGIAAIKSLISASYHTADHDLRTQSLAFSDTAFTSTDCAEGVAAFRAKRRPRFDRSSIS